MSGPSPQWAAIRARLERSLDIVAERRNGLDGRTRDGRKLTVDVLRGHRSEWLVLRTPVCPEGELDPKRVLEENAKLVFAVLVLHEREYFLRFEVPLDSAEAGDLEELLALFLDAAATVQTGDGSRRAGVFAHYGS